MSDDLPARTVPPHATGWTAQRTWRAGLVTAGAALLPLIVASVRLVSCLLGAISLRPAGGAAAAGTASAARPVACSWSWQALLCRPLAWLAAWLHPPGAGGGALAWSTVLLALPVLAALTLGGVWLVRAAVACARSVSLARASAREVGRLSLPPSHAAARRLTSLVQTTGNPDLRLHVLDAERPFALTYGWWRPQVALSTGLLARLDDAALATVVAHESVHARRRDPFRRLVSLTMKQACPHAPLLRALDAHLRLRQEVEADGAAADLGGRAAVARALVAGLATAPARTLSTSTTATASAGPARISTGSAGDDLVVRSTTLRATQRGTSQTGRWISSRRQVASARDRAQAEEAPSGLACRVDHLLGRAPAAGALVPAATIVLSVSGIAIAWCLLVW